MAEDEERRKGAGRTSRRDPARAARRDLPVIEGEARDVTPISDNPVTSGPATEPASVEWETSTSVSPPVDTTLESSARPEAAAETVLPETPVDSVAQAETTTPHETPVVEKSTATEQAFERPRPASPAQDTGSHTSHADDAPLPRTAWATLLALAFLLLAGGLLYLFYQVSSLDDAAATTANLRSRVATLEGRPAADSAAITARLSKLEGSMSDLQASVAGLGKRLDAMAGAVSAQSGMGAHVADLQSEVAGVKSGIAALQAGFSALPRPDLGKVETRMGDLDQKIGALQSAVSTIPHVDLGPLTGKVDALDSRLKPVEAEVEAATSPEQIARRKAAPLAVTAQAISAAIADGHPFPQQFTTLKALGADPARLAPLQAVSENGAPTVIDLQNMLADLRDRIIAKGAAPPSGSYFDRLVSGASNLVQVRPLGSAPGDTPAAITARMKDAIGTDDLAGALADWKKLPEPSQAVSKGLADQLTLRLNAEQAANALANSAIGAMTGSR